METIRDGNDTSINRFDGVQILTVPDIDTVFRNPRIENSVGDMGLELPLFILSVVPSDLVVEGSAQSTDNVLAAEVRPPESAGCHATDVLARLEDDDT